jgi:hypothetical protein
MDEHHNHDVLSNGSCLFLKTTMSNVYMNYTDAALMELYRVNHRVHVVKEHSKLMDSPIGGRLGYCVRRPYLLLYIFVVCYSMKNNSDLLRLAEAIWNNHRSSIYGPWKKMTITATQRWREIHQTVQPRSYYLS